MHAQPILPAFGEVGSAQEVHFAQQSSTQRGGYGP